MEDKRSGIATALVNTAKTVFGDLLPATGLPKYDVTSLIVQDLQTDQLNEHLGYLLDTFDQEFAKCEGPLGTPYHLEERERFAQIAAGSIVKWQHENPGPISDLETQIEYVTSNGVGIGVVSHTTWDGSAPALGIR